MFIGILYMRIGMWTHICYTFIVNNNAAEVRNVVRKNYSH